VPPPSKPTPAGNASQPRQTWAAPA
jgi:hypothetical protein